MTTLDEIRQSVIGGKWKQVTTQVAQALDEGIPPLEILDATLVPAMDEVGRRFECGEFYLQEMIVAAKAMKEAVAILKPHLQGAEVKSIGKVVLGTVKGDLHDIGKNLVGAMLESAGFAIVDLGSDVSPEKFVAAILDHQPQIVGMSALLTTTMMGMKKVMEALEAAGVRGSVKVMIGGAPVTEEFAHQIDADGYAADAASAILRAKALLGAG